jgi:hypothetical protein
MLDMDFCTILEYKICEALANIDNEILKWYWCDGVLLSEPDNYYSQKYINDNRQTQMKAFVGKDGQTEYRLILKFGRKALSRYARDLDITECIPNADYEKWFTIDTDNKEIEIQLD